MFTLLLTIHVICVVISAGLFLWRGTAMWIGQPLSNIYYRRILPDSVDTVLLFSGVTLAYILGYSLFEGGWLAAKIVGLVIYIVLGAIALKYGRSKMIKRFCFLAAIGVFMGIVYAARQL